MRRQRSSLSASGVLAALLGLVAGLGRVSGEYVCDSSEEKRTAIDIAAVVQLQKQGFQRVAPAQLYYHPAKQGALAGNPNTLYAFVTFNDTTPELYPRGYPPPSFPGSGIHPPGPPKPLPTGVTFGSHEAIAILMCTPPPAKYFGMTAYVQTRLLIDDPPGAGDGDVIAHTPMVEVASPLNYLNINTSSGAATEDRRDDPSSFFGSTALIVYASSRQAYDAIADAYVAAGVPRHATNFYPLPAQTIRFHDRTKAWDYDYPDLMQFLSRVTYFDNQTDGMKWSEKPFTAHLFQAPVSPIYSHSVPEQLLLNDVSGESERPLVPVVEKLLDAIVANKTSDGRSRLVRREQLLAVPNDRATQLKCLTNMTYVAAVDPVITIGGCGAGTRDCRYGTSPTLSVTFGENRYFVIVGVRHEALKHSSYSSIMFTSKWGYEKAGHTITFRETDGAGAPAEFAPEMEEGENLYAVTLARKCPEGDRYCLEFTRQQFAPWDILYLMERAYLQRSTGVAPNIDEYVMSYVLTFEGSP